MIVYINMMFFSYCPLLISALLINKALVYYVMQSEVYSAMHTLCYCHDERETVNKTSFN